MLAACLDSLAAQIIPSHVRPQLVARYLTRAPLPVRYLHEPRRGMQARNAAMAKAVELGVDWIAVLDDDEEADRRRHQPAAAQGPQPQPPRQAAAREAKEACQIAAVVIDVYLTCAISGEALDAGEVEKRYPQPDPSPALQRLQAALAASSTRGGCDA
jgi:hypothetical protein